MASEISRLEQELREQKEIRRKAEEKIALLERQLREARSSKGENYYGAVAMRRRAVQATRREQREELRGRRLKGDDELGY